MYPAKHLEIFLDDKSPDSRARTNSWVTLWKETEVFTGLKDELAQLACG
jgi:hypothetical protein